METNQENRNFCLEEIYKNSNDSSDKFKESQQIQQPNKTGSGIFLYFTVFIVNLISFACGEAFGWTSPILPKLNGNVDPDLNPLPEPLTVLQQSWVASLLSIGCAIGPLIGGRISDKIGRKKTLIILSIPMIIAHLLAAYTKTVELLYISRLLMGACVGSVFAVLPIYLAEISENHNRGILGCSFSFFLAAGILFSFIIGPIFTVKWFSLICIVPLILFIICFTSFIPESPFYLASIHDDNGIRQSLRKLRSNLTNLQPEISRITKFVELSNQRKRGGGFRELIQKKSNRKGLIITLVLIILQQVAGVNVVMAYMQSIFDETGSKIPSTISTVIIGFVQLLATVLTLFVVDRLGRKILLILSTLLSAISLFALGLYFYLKTNHYEEIVEKIFWLPIVSLIVFIVCFNFGLGPIPWAMMAELFPPNVISIASTLASFSCFGTSSSLIFCFSYLSSIVGKAQIFGVFSTFCVIGTIFIYLVVPETKGKSLQEIQRMLDRSSS